MKIYIRRKEPGKGWRCRAVPKVGRRPVAEAGAKFHVRYPDADYKFVWSQGYDSFEEAEKAAAGLEPNVKAVALGFATQSKPCWGIRVWKPRRGIWALTNLDSLTDKIDAAAKATLE